jgi:hypothetical protein
VVELLAVRRRHDVAAKIMRRSQRGHFAHTNVRGEDQYAKSLAGIGDPQYLQLISGASAGPDDDSAGTSCGAFVG